MSNWSGRRAAPKCPRASGPTRSCIRARRTRCWAPRDPIPLADEAWGCDLEAEIVVVTGDVPRGVSREEALAGIRLVGLVNDVSLRNLIPAELAKGFGFVQSKPASALSPVFVTPDELGEAWADGKLSRRAQGRPQRRSPSAAPMPART